MRYLKFLIPPFLVIVIDLLFQLGIWEPIAAPDSHAGMSITKKLALADPAFQHIDFVALGNSRAIYGIDHAQIAQAATLDKSIYANLSVAGSHWMSVGVIVDWLTRYHPEIRGGVIAMGVQDFASPGDNYEIAIASPFRTQGETSRMVQYVPFDWHNPATYGLYSGLFQYHEDVEDLLAHPKRRWDVVNWYRALTPQRVLAGSMQETADMCGTPVKHLSDCSDLEHNGNNIDARIPPQCKQLVGTSSARFDLHPFLNNQQPLTERLRVTRDLIRARLRSLNWQVPPIVVLMPMQSVWLSDALPSGVHDWALYILEPLVAENRIRLLDYTDMFAGDDECRAFFDLYHNNALGQNRIMDRLMPELERNLLHAANGINSSASRY